MTQASDVTDHGGRWMTVASLWEDLRQVGLDQLPLAVTVAIYWAGIAVVQVCCAGSALRIDLHGVLRDSAYWFALGGFLSVLGSTVLFVWRDWRQRHLEGVPAMPRPGGEAAETPGPLRRWLRHLGARFGVIRVAGAAAAVVILVVFLDLYLPVKTAIPSIEPFNWDAALYHVDRLLAFGHDPWRLLQPVLGHPAATRILDDGYALWFIVIMGTLVWQCWSPRRGLRSRFLLAFLLCWVVIGSVLATIFSSAGPAYYGRVVGHPDPFAPLMAYLHVVDTVHPVTALEMQRYLWEGYTGVAVHAVEGISAMPSMHVSMAVLSVLLVARIHRVFALLYGAFAVLIFLGSIALAWHYAVDGYAAAILTVGCWWIACQIMDGYESVTRRPADGPASPGEG